MGDGYSHPSPDFLWLTTAHAGKAAPGCPGEQSSPVFFGVMDHGLLTPKLRSFARPDSRGGGFPHVVRGYLCWLTESTFPSGSLNQATLSPLGAVQIPSSRSSMKGYFSHATPCFCSQRTTASISFTSHPRTV